MQSAYRAGHSTETVSLRIVNDNFILSALDSDNISFLLLLDLSAAFDTTDHHILLSRLQKNNLSNPFQSAYRAGCSTETVLLYIVNDILSALDNDNISVLLLLDLSAAFDTLDHTFSSPA